MLSFDPLVSTLADGRPFLHPQNLDSNLSSQDLFNAFRTFGQIVRCEIPLFSLSRFCSTKRAREPSLTRHVFSPNFSARVMKDEMGVSRGFGFVSYHNPQDGASPFLNFPHPGELLLTPT